MPPFKLFISYSHHDRELCERLKKSLAPLKRMNLITAWYDRNIQAGKEFEAAIFAELAAAKIILLLVSDDFINSEYAFVKELALALKRHDAGEAIVIPVILRACMWQDMPFGKLQCLPSNSVPAESWANKDEAYLDIAKGVRETVESWVAEKGVAHFERPRTQCNLPPRTFGRLIGREEDLKRIMEGLDLRFPVLAIEGFKGVGKTSLAIETGYVCYDHSNRYEINRQRFDYVVWVSANDKPGQTNWLDEVLNEIAGVMGYDALAQLPADQVETKKQKVNGLLYYHRLLLLIDNFETINDPELEKWLYRIPEPCKVIITSRKNQLQSAFKIDLTGLNDAEALHFIRQTAHTLHLLDLEKEEDNLLLNLVRVTGGNPKAMEMALGNIKGGTLNLRELIEQINNNNPGESMDDVFDYLYADSWKRISEDAKRILLTIPLFTASSSINPDAMRAASGLETFAFRSARSELLDWKLLQINTRIDRSSRILVHPITREFVAGKLKATTAFEKEARKRVCDFYLSLVKKYIVRDDPAEEYWNALVSDKMNTIDEEEEWPNIEEILRWVCAEKLDELLVNYVMVLVHYLDSRFLNQERITYIENAVKAAHKSGLKYKEALLRIDALGWTYVEENNLLKAYDEISKGIRLATEVKEETGKAEELIALGHAWWARAKIEENKEDEALAAINVAMAYQDETKHWITFRILMAAGDIYLKQQKADPQKALRSYLEAKAQMEKYGGEGNYYQINPRIGLAHLAVNNLEEAEKVFKSLTQFRQISIGKLYGDYGIALVRFKQSRLDEATALLNTVKYELSKKTSSNLLKQLIEDFERVIVSFSGEGDKTTGNGNGTVASGNTGGSGGPDNFFGGAVPKDLKNVLTGPLKNQKKPVRHPAPRSPKVPRISQAAPDMTPPDAGEKQAVLLGASAPQAVKPGQEFTARFAAYVKELEPEIKGKMEKLSPSSQVHLGLKECLWQTGTRVTVRVSGTGLQVDPPEDGFEWNGQSCLLDFCLTVLETAPEQVVLKFDVFIAGISVARMRIDQAVTNKPAATPQEVITQPIRSAFASYASADRQRVLDRVAEISRNGVDVFLDCMSMKPGEKWEHELEEEIKKRQSFLLFWSSSARESKWVEWEWKTALKERGLTGIEPHPLEDPTVAPPPAELSGLHFNDLYMLVRKASAPVQRPDEKV